MDWTSRKKLAERAILSMVYELTAFQLVEESERPDFALRRPDGSGLFGVEVTQLYHSEAAARLEHIRGYVGELLSGEKHRHKDDVTALIVDDVTLEKADGTAPQAIRAIVETLPPLADHIRMIVDRIELKSVALSGRRADLTHVNLILHDKTGRFRGVTSEHVARLLFEGGVQEASAKATFREVFYVSDINENRRVFFPLRMLFLVSELFMFNAARVTSGIEEVAVQSRDEELILFGSFMRARGIPVVLTRNTEDGRVQAILGNSGVLVADDSVSVRDYMDSPIPETWIPPDRPFSEAFLAFYDRYSREHVFHSGIVFDAHK